MATILKGAPAAAALTEELKERCGRLRGAGITPKLAILRVGERPDDLSYETGAKKRCEKIGIAAEPFLFPADAAKEDVLAAIERINADEDIHGCLMFRPLPDPGTETAACKLLEPKKDADAMTAAALAGVFTGSGEGYPPCTAEAVMELLDYYRIPLQGKRVTVVGRSLVIGKPVAMMLLNRNATITMCHTKTADLPAACRNAELLVVAAGHPGTIDARHVAPGQIVIDVGINVDAEGRLCGDADFGEIEPLVGAVTPVPGGVGALTTAVLCRHVIEAAEKKAACR